MNAEQATASIFTDKVVISLLSGFVGAVLVYFIQYFTRKAEEKKIERAVGQVIRAEIEIVGENSAKFLRNKVQSQLARLSTYCFEDCIIRLTSYGSLSKEEANSLLRFYDLAKTVNRSLDNVEDLFEQMEKGDDENKKSNIRKLLKRENGRTRRKAERIASKYVRPDGKDPIFEGNHYKEAIEVTEKWVVNPCT